MRFRTARPTNDLAALERFYVEGAGLGVLGRFEEHDGFSGVILGAGTWQVEFIVEAGVTAPRAPTHEHLLVLYLPARELERRAQKLDQLGARRVTPNNAWWAEHGVTFEDPDGYHFVLAREDATHVHRVVKADGLVLREATGADEATLTALHARCWNDDNTPTGAPPPALAEGRLTFVAERGGEVVGAVQLSSRTTFASNAHVALLTWLAVAPEARRTGVGLALSQHVIDEASRRGYRKLALNVMSTNPGALALYQSLGFELEARRVAEFQLNGRFVDSLELARTLP